MEALRAKDAFSLDDVYCATMETNGQLSVMFQNKTQPPTMEDLGMVAKENDMPLGDAEILVGVRKHAKGRNSDGGKETSCPRIDSGEEKSAARKRKDRKRRELCSGLCSAGYSRSKGVACLIPLWRGRKTTSRPEQCSPVSAFRFREQE